MLAYTREKTAVISGKARGRILSVLDVKYSLLYTSFIGIDEKWRRSKNRVPWKRGVFKECEFPRLHTFI